MIERKIVTGLIVSTPFLENIRSTWSMDYLESVTARQISLWVWEYYDKYHKAPGKDIETIFYLKLREGRISQDMASDMEDILRGLSSEYERGEQDLTLLTEETLKYFECRRAEILARKIEEASKAGRVDLVRSLSQEIARDVTSSDISKHILTIPQIRRMEHKPPRVLMKPWLREGQFTIIYGNYGCGKSLLAISIAYMLGVRDYDKPECQIGEWQVKNPTGCLYIDGELGEVEMEERVSQFEWLGPQPSSRKLRVLSLPEYQLREERSFSLSDRSVQKSVVKWLSENPEYRLVILDSISTLFELEDENSNSEWNNKINPFLRDLRAMGVACILLHHSGKDGKRGLRGASTMGAMAHNIFRLVNHEKKSEDAGEAWFVLTKDKQRSGGYEFKSFGLRYSQDDNGKSTTWEVTGVN